MIVVCVGMVCLTVLASLAMSLSAREKDRLSMSRATQLLNEIARLEKSVRTVEADADDLADRVTTWEALIPEINTLKRDVQAMQLRGR